MQQPVRERRLPVINVGDDAEISDVRGVHLQGRLAAMANFRIVDCKTRLQPGLNFSVLHPKTGLVV